MSRHYGDRVLAYWQAVNTTVSSVEVNLVPPPAPRRANDIIAMPPVPSPQNSYQPPMPRMGPSIGRGVDEIFQGPEARYTFANFVVGKPNEFAYAAARNIAEQDRPLPERNPLYIFGGVGLGKTHLMHAIWHSIRERRSEQRVLYLTAESFVNRFYQVLRTKNTNQFKELFRYVRRGADGGRRAVDPRQGSEPGRVLLHLQFAARRAEQADRALVGEAAQRAAGH